MEETITLSELNGSAANVPEPIKLSIKRHFNTSSKIVINSKGLNSISIINDMISDKITSWFKETLLKEVPSNTSILHASICGFENETITKLNGLTKGKLKVILIAEYNQEFYSLGFSKILFTHDRREFTIFFSKELLLKAFEYVISPEIDRKDEIDSLDINLDEDRYLVDNFYHENDYKADNSSEFHDSEDDTTPDEWYEYFNGDHDMGDLY